MTEALDENQDSQEIQVRNLRLLIQDIIGHCEGELRILELGLSRDTVATTYASRLHPSVLTSFIELTRQELEALKALDPGTTSIEEVHEITGGFINRRIALMPKDE